MEHRRFEKNYATIYKPLQECFLLRIFGITAETGWIQEQEGRTDFSSASRTRITLFGHDDDVNRLTVPPRQRLRQFPEKNDATATRALLPHRRVKTMICLSVFVTPLVCIRHPDCPLISVSRQSARTKDRPDAV